MLRNRLIVLGLFILSIIAVSFYGGPATYGFFFLMLLIPIFGIAYCYLVYFRFRIYQKILTKNVIADTPTEFYFNLQNEDFYSFSGIKVEFFSDFSSITELDDFSEYELSPHSGVKKETVLTCKYRGEYDVGVRNIIVQDYLRLFKFNFKNKENLRAVVRPRLEILESLSEPDFANTYKDSMINPVEPDVLVREYIPGDDVRTINWKISSHLGKLYVRKRIGEETSGIGIIMDSYRYSPDPKKYLPLENKILETTLALTHFYLSKGIRTSIHTFDNKPQTFNLQDISAFEDFYEALSNFTFAKNNTAKELFVSAGHSAIFSCSLVYLIINDLGAEALFEINELNRNGIRTIVYCINDEEKNISDFNISKNTEFKRIGYEDKLKEVL